MSNKGKIANPATAAAAAAAAKTKTPSMKWINKEETRFIQEFSKVKKTKKEQATGAATGMSTHGWKTILDAMNRAAPNDVVYTKAHLQNKMPTLVKDYKSYEFLMHKTGLGCTAEGAFTGSESVKAECSETDKNCSKFFKHPLANYALLDTLLR